MQLLNRQLARKHPFNPSNRLTAHPIRFKYPYLLSVYFPLDVNRRTVCPLRFNYIDSTLCFCHFGAMQRETDSLTNEQISLLGTFCDVYRGLICLLMIRTAKGLLTTPSDLRAAGHAQSQIYRLEKPIRKRIIYVGTCGKGGYKWQ